MRVTICAKYIKKAVRYLLPGKMANLSEVFVFLMTSSAIYEILSMYPAGAIMAEHQVISST